MTPSVLRNMQKEFLKLYTTDFPDEQLKEIKLMLSNYFAEKPTAEMDKLWDKNKWDEKTINQWANEHTRRKDKLPGNHNS